MTMRFDSNKAWQDAVQAVTANRDVLWALAGVFYVLPSFAFAVAFPQPEPPAGSSPEQLLAQLGSYYTSAAPFMLVTMVLQLIGTLAILTMMTDSRRPTVGEAIRIGAASMLPVLAAQLLLGFGLGLVAAFALGLAGLSGSVPLIVALSIMLVAAIFYLSVRTMLVAPAVAVDGLRNPIAALRRSWDLTSGKAGPLALFFVLLVIAAAVIFGIVMLVTGVVLALLAGPETAKLIAALVSSALVAGVTVLFVGVVAAVHRQLAGPTADTTASTFD